MERLQLRTLADQFQANAAIAIWRQLRILALHRGRRQSGGAGQFDDLGVHGPGEERLQPTQPRL